MYGGSCPEGQPNKGGHPPGLTHQYIRDHGELKSDRRKDCTCIYCPHRYISCRPEAVWKHILQTCPSISKKERKAAQDLKTSGTQLSAPQNGKRLRSAGTPKGSSASQQSVSAVTPAVSRVTPALQKELDVKLLRAFVHAGIPPNAVEDPFVLDFIWSCRPGYSTPGQLLWCTASNLASEVI